MGPIGFQVFFFPDKPAEERWGVPRGMGPFGETWWVYGPTPNDALIAMGRRILDKQGKT